MAGLLFSPTWIPSRSTRCAAHGIRWLAVPEPPSTAPPDPGYVRPRRADEFRIRSILWTVYLPTFLLSIGQGLVIVQVPLLAKELGAGFGLIGVAVAAREIGTMLMDVPSGVMVSKFGSKRTMIAGTAAIGAAAIGAVLAQSVALFIVMRLAQGGFTAMWSISRQAYIADVVPVQTRGRALALFGGVNRIALIVGPVSAGFLAFEFGLEAPFFVQGAVSIATAVIVLALLKDRGAVRLVPDGESTFGRLSDVIVGHRRAFATAGVAAICMQLIRNGRQIMIPLWGDSIGLDVRQINGIMGISSFIDSLFFYPVGIVMDRWGRKWVFVPSLLVLGSSLILIPTTGSFGTLLAVALWAGVGNGISSGIVFTLGVDLAPPNRRGEFIGVWRLIGDAGGSTGPFIVGWIAQAATLAVASVVTGGIGIFGAAVAFFLVKETLVRRDRRRRD